MLNLRAELLRLLANNTMNNKDRLQMYVSLTKITIVLCWLSLFSFWAIKIFGGNWFEIMVENENFVEFSNKVQNTWLKYLVSLFTISFSFYMMFGAVIQKIVLKGKYLLVFVLCAISNWLIVNFTEISFLKTIYGYTILILCGVAFQNGRKKLYGFLATILDFVFVLLSMVTRNIKLGFVTDYLIILILMIDVYIMYVLYALYSYLIKIKQEI